MSAVGLVLVAHSAKLAEGLADVAGQMAPGVTLVPAGGRSDGGIGTSFDRVSSAIAQAEGGGGVVVLCDLGSAYLTAEGAIELTTGVHATVVHTAFAEGTVAAAVAAAGGADLEGVVRAAESAGSEGDVAEPAFAPQSHSRRVTLVNRDGLHARPAAEFVKLAIRLGEPVTVNGVDASSLLGILSLGLVEGALVDIAGPSGSSRAVDALADLVAAGFAGLGEDQRDGDRPGT